MAKPSRTIRYEILFQLSLCSLCSWRCSVHFVLCVHLVGRHVLNIAQQQPHIKSEKNNQRPPRKAYGRLSIEPDENCNRSSNHHRHHQFDNPFDDFDNFNILDDKCTLNDNAATGQRQAANNDNDTDTELESSTSSRCIDNECESTVKNLQAMVISDDEDYGKCSARTYNLIIHPHTHARTLTHAHFHSH